MQSNGNTVLITGGSEGIGFELAKALAPENTVIICGRSAEKLAKAQAELPGTITMTCDVTDAKQREDMISRILHAHPACNVLVNNAGGRRRIDIETGEGAEAALEFDTALNFTAPAWFCARLLPHLRIQLRSAIVNISTGLVYLPKTAYPFYCAAKAALHSYTQGLRWALRDSSVRVHEVLLPLVDTNFHQGELPATIPAMSAKEAARQTLAHLVRGREEIRIGKSGLARWLAFVAPKKGMAIVNR